MFKFFRGKKDDKNQVDAAGGDNDDLDDDAENPVDAAGGGGGELYFDGNDEPEHDDYIEDEESEEEDEDESEYSDADSQDFRGKKKYKKEFETSSMYTESVYSNADGVSSTYSQQGGDGYCYGYLGGGGDGATGDGRNAKNRKNHANGHEYGEEDIAAAKAATAAKNARFTRFLGKDERSRAAQVFKLLDVEREGKIDSDGFATALALMGMKIPTSECQELFLSRGLDLVDEETFVSMVGEYRASDGEQILQIESAFENLYRGILAEREGGFVEQRDGIGRPYILAADLRDLLVSSGEQLTDEEADRVISDCNPIYKVMSDGTVTGKIFFEQYRAMLLPGPQ
jgi:Ca2+-binding EF-hand superfamily protein